MVREKPCSRSRGNKWQRQDRRWEHVRSCCELWGSHGCHCMMAHLALPTAARRLCGWAVIPARCPITQSKIWSEDLRVWRGDICGSFQLSLGARLWKVLTEEERVQAFLSRRACPRYRTPRAPTGLVALIREFQRHPTQEGTVAPFLILPSPGVTQKQLITHSIVLAHTGPHCFPLAQRGGPDNGLEWHLALLSPMLHLFFFGPGFG